MIGFAHVGSVPLEETLRALAAASSGLLVARGWLMLRLRWWRGSGK